ncbi:hypothetical protein [Actinoplanes sp. NPDC049118]|uniref:hypothetical protein n=1 Tax=Actinoplanes sp. NPDC049118 TaxID=3155769 RepID=UPI0033F74F1C
MGTWLATIRFPDGTCKYARYSTVVEEMYHPLYAECSIGGDRGEVAGEPLPGRPELPRSAAADLVPVVIDVESYNDAWHALYCPRRALLAGPFSGFHRDRMQAEFELARDEHGVRHLGWSESTSLCGRPLTGEPLVFHDHLADWGPMEPPEPIEPVEVIDLYADWDEPDMCRACLLTTVAVLPERDVVRPDMTLTMPDRARTAGAGWWRRLLGR